jgi:hypothetical protein
MLKNCYPIKVCYQIYTIYISENYYVKYCFIQTYVVFAAGEASLNEHHIAGGREIQFKNNDLHYPGRTENWQREIVASDLPETNYKAVLMIIKSASVFQIRIYLPAFCSERSYMILRMNRDYVCTQH